MKRLFALLVVLTGLFVAFLGKNNPIGIAEVADLSPQRREQTAPLTLERPPMSSSRKLKAVAPQGTIESPHLGKASRGGRQALRKMLPPLKIVRAETARDPHGTPPALLAFAVEVAERLETALNDEAEATVLFSELESCALSKPEESISSARGYCVVNARKLAKKFPSLRRDFVELTAQVDGEALQLASRLNP